MYIHIVQPSDNIDSIAINYGVTVTSLIQNNGLINPYDLVPGQTIVVLYPEQVHTVAEGDSLAGIADAYGVSLMQLLRNNSYLSDREYLSPGETIVISYQTGRQITTNGIAYPYISRDALRKTLPYLTYLSIYNYRVTGQGEIASYYDDSEVIQMAKEYGTVPLMLVTTLTTQGEPNPEIAYDILTTEEYQNTFIEDMLDIIRAKGFYGINIFYYSMDAANKEIYENFSLKVSERLISEGYLFFMTINPNIYGNVDSRIIGAVDYSTISKNVNNIAFLHLIWGTNYGPPAPVISINNVRQFLNYTVPGVTPGLIDLGIPIIGYDWELPFIAGISEANSLTLNAALILADDYTAEIQFDENSQTPFFTYVRYINDFPVQHIVRFIDARTINSLVSLIPEYGLNGVGIWNIMIFNEQLWAVIISQYEIIKVITDSLSG